ncbi:MAG: hypothetical protein NTW87_20770 [Planctomycetota bacterium]|nr:hypothetical protein [Planctomycetota bacterium]
MLMPYEHALLFQLNTCPANGKPSTSKAAAPARKGNAHCASSRKLQKSIAPAVMRAAGLIRLNGLGVSVASQTYAHRRPPQVR